MENIDTSNKLVLEYNGDSMDHYRKYFDERIEILEWHVKQYKRKIERAEERINELTPPPIGVVDVDPDWERKVADEKQDIKFWEFIIKDHIYEPLGWLYEIKHQIMKIDIDDDGI